MFYASIGSHHLVSWFSRGQTGESDVTRFAQTNMADNYHTTAYMKILRCGQLSKYKLFPDNILFDCKLGTLVPLSRRKNRFSRKRQWKKDWNQSDLEKVNVYESKGSFIHWTTYLIPVNLTFLYVSFLRILLFHIFSVGIDYCCRHFALIHECSSIRTMWPTDLLETILN